MKHKTSSLKKKNKKMSHYKTQICLCVSPGCADLKEGDLAKELRELVKEMGLNEGEKKIKITKTKCVGACSHGQVAQIVENTQRNGYPPNNALWLKEVHTFSKERWMELFKYLSENEDIKNKDFKFVPMEEIE